MSSFGPLTVGRNSRVASSIDNADSNTGDKTALSNYAPSPALPQGGVTVPMIMATILVFMHLGRPFDQFLFGYHVPAILGSVAILVMLFTRWIPTLRTSVGVSLVLFSAIMCVACVTSIWRGGSATYVQQFLELNVVVFCLLGAAPTTVGQVRWLALVALFACVFNVAVGSGFDAQGRLYLTDAMYGNSDDVALLGGFCIPLVLLLAARLGKIFGTIAGLIGVVGCLAVVGLSATRFALISLTVMAFSYFWRSGGTRRVALILCFLTLFVGSIFLLPKSTVDRLSTITSMFSGEEGGGRAIDNEAINSMRERQQLAKDALQAFVTHPILGVGPNVFVDWRYDVLGRRGQPAHNTYLQVAGENGVLGLVFYCAFVVSLFVTLRRCLKSFEGWEDGHQVALALQPAWIYFLVSAFFINCLSHAHQFVLAGLAVALDRLRSEYATAAASVPAEASEEKIVNLSSSPAVLPVKPRPIAPNAVSEPATRYRFNRPVSTSRRN